MSTSTMGSFARMPNDTMADLYSSSTGLGDAIPKRASSIVK